mmetsp:Transcript_11256/g.22581  ORF Transcript_11256/g.22581 Transcript_11256/m.22581 type:complete len:211 (-) Transcript_11256:106-738(-)
MASGASKRPNSPSRVNNGNGADDDAGFAGKGRQRSLNGSGRLDTCPQVRHVTLVSRQPENTSWIALLLLRAVVAVVVVVVVVVAPPLPDSTAAAAVAAAGGCTCTAFSSRRSSKMRRSSAESCCAVELKGGGRQECKARGEREGRRDPDPGLNTASVWRSCWVNVLRAAAAAAALAGRGRGPDSGGGGAGRRRKRRKSPLQAKHCSREFK